MRARKKPAAALVRGAVERAFPAESRIVLAVSGGRDSMVLLDAAARWCPGAVAAVATFDHGTGAFARAAVELVEAEARRHGFAFVHDRATGLPASEAAWRWARWRFLRRTAAPYRARIATAHTQDDQIETVVIRLLRDAGPRGLAGLYAASDVARPLIDVSRDAVALYARVRDIAFAEDPSNTSRAFLRNRVRLDLLPAFEAARPGFSRELLELSRRAAAWRSEVERFVDALEPWRDGDSLFVNAAKLAGVGEQAREIVWPALAARVGIALDRRGTERLATFSTFVGRQQRLPIAGGHEIIRRERTFEIRPGKPHA
jgi:tRNA(Ile)-lysidine synthase